MPDCNGPCAASVRQDNLIIEDNNPDHIARDYSLSESIYSYGYDLRLKYSSFKQDTLDWVANNFSEVLPMDEPKILSLGCGAGMFDCELIKLVKQRKKEWFFSGLDFSATDLDGFRKSLSAFDTETRARVALEYRKFDASTDLGECYDLVTMIHFLHAFDDVLPVIQNALRHLAPGGSLFIVQQKSKGISELKKQFLDILPNQKFNCTEYIKKLLLKEKIVFTSHEFEAEFDVSVMRKMSLETLLLMSFCLVNDLSLLDTALQDKIRQAFLSQATVQNDATAVIFESMEVIICHV